MSRIAGLDGLAPGWRELVERASDAVDRAYRPRLVTVGAAVRATSGRIHTGVNLDTSGYGPCAEPVAVGAAFAAGEADLLELVAVARREEEHLVLPPCGNCRQLLLDFAPEARLLLPVRGTLETMRVAELLPEPYRRPALSRRDEGPR